MASEEIFNLTEVDKRPKFGSLQIDSPIALKVGERYVGHLRHFKGWGIWTPYEDFGFEVLEDPMLDPSWPQVKVKFDTSPNDLSNEQRILLGHWGISPLPNRKWHPFNWVGFPDYKILGIPEREQLLADSLRVMVERMGPQANIPAFDVEGVDLSTRMYVDSILRGTTFGIHQLRTMEGLIKAQPDIGFDGFMQRLRGGETKS